MQLPNLRPIFRALLNLSALLCFFSTSVALSGTWETHEASTKASLTKIRAKEKDISEMVEKKHHTHDPAAIEAILEDIKKEYKALVGLQADYNKEMSHMRFEHPEQGDKSERKYLPYKLKSLEQFEKEGGVDGKLNQVKLRMLDQYGDPLPKSRAPACDKQCQSEMEATPAPTPNRILFSK